MMKIELILVYLDYFPCYFRILNIDSPLFSRSSGLLILNTVLINRKVIEITKKNNFQYKYQKYLKNELNLESH